MILSPTELQTAKETLGYLKQKQSQLRFNLYLNSLFQDRIDVLSKLIDFVDNRKE